MIKSLIVDFTKISEEGIKELKNRKVTDASWI